MSNLLLVGFSFIVQTRFCRFSLTFTFSEEGNNRYKLDNDPMCGLVTGGRPECWWSCDIQRVENPSKPGRVLQLIAEPSCLSDCYPGGHCLNALLADYHSAGGICRGSYLDVIAPGLFPVSRQPCELHEPDDYYHGHEIRKGLCSERTKLLLSDQQNCIHPLWKQKSSIVATANNLIRSMCDFRTWWFDFNKPVPIDRRVDTRIKTNETRKYDPLKRMRPSHDYENKLIPIDSIEEINGVNFARVPPLENTKHRYPWICSLRSRSRSVHYWEIEPRHFCGVTLLSRPPGPTVLVTSAHCVYICMSEEGRLVPNCCCPNVGPGLCTEDEACGTNAATVEITGADAEVICGEWDSATDTAEEYNVILPIESIAVHPSFDISRGEKNSQFVADDIAIIKVSDDKFEAQSRTHHIYPACLPTNNKPLTTGAVHSGWSKSPSLDYVTTHAPKYKEFYGEFSKQWHHSMKIRKCEDPQTFFWTGVPLKYPTNSYYPPGTICATEILGEFCPTSGESGSPLMVTDDHGRMAALGINSFIKGCSAFIFRKKSSTYESLTQKSENPAVYTKLSCYLPWVAAQYNMDYTPPEGGDPDPACLTGVGDINEVTAKVCRTNPSGWADDRDDIEAPCLFPFSLNGESHDTCIMDEIEGFTRPLFKCPIRRVKGYGTNYIDSHATGGHEIAGFFCPTNW